VQVRSLAVCKSWRRCLDPHCLELESCSLDLWEEDDPHPVALWLCRTKPPVRVLKICISEKIELDSPAATAMRDALLAVQPKAVSFYVPNCFWKQLAELLRLAAWLCDLGRCRGAAEHSAGYGPSCYPQIISFDAR
jgi:hypothetical protein